MQDTGISIMKKSRRKSRGNSELPEFVVSLFQEYKPGSLDIDAHADLIVERIMERGSFASMGWLKKTYPRQQLVSFLERRGKRVLPARELNYWALVCGVPAAERREWVEKARERTDVWSARTSH
jgi:hypothetical protein